MAPIREIKTLQAQGWSVPAIATAVHVDRKTVRKYLQQTDVSPPPPTTAPRPSTFDPYKATIDRWLADDASQWVKQRHTAQRIYDRLRAEYPACDASYATVRRYVRQQRHPAPTTGTRDLVWHPGEAQVDFGQADVYVAGRRVRAHYLCVTFPYSNAGYLPWFRGENAECVGHGLVTVCTPLGGAPRRLVFDNASGVGPRRGGTVHLTELFQRCQAHHGFETTFSNPAAGYEKGNVENKLGDLRRNLLVPPPRSPMGSPRIARGSVTANSSGPARTTQRASRSSRSSATTGPRCGRSRPRRSPRTALRGSAPTARAAFGSRGPTGIRRPRSWPSKRASCGWGRTPWHRSARTARS